MARLETATVMARLPEEAKSTIPKTTDGLSETPKTASLWIKKRTISLSKVYERRASDSANP
jgi:hypothetical protein